MRVFSYETSKEVVNNFGLNYPERFQLHFCSRLGMVANFFCNFVLGRNVSYVVWKHDVHLTPLGVWHLDRHTLDLMRLRGVMQETERSPRKAFILSLRNQS